MSAEIGGGAAKAPALALPRWNSDKNRSQGNSFLRTGGDMFIGVVGQTAPALVSYFLFVISTGSVALHREGRGGGRGGGGLANPKLGQARGLTERLEEATREHTKSTEQLAALKAAQDAGGGG